MLKARGAQVDRAYHREATISHFLHLDHVLLLSLGVEKLKSRINIQALGNQRDKRLLFIATRDHWYIL